MAFINKKNTSGHPLVLSVDTDYTLPGALDARTTAFEALRVMDVAEEPHEVELSLAEKLKHFKDELVELRPEREEEGDGEHQVISQWH